MPSFTTVFTLAVAAAATVASAAPVANKRKDAPSTWAHGYLEDYQTYHVRYLALDCQDQHNTTFFEDCCHPLLASESLSDRPTECTPTATASVSASSVAETASADDSEDDEEYCSEESNVSSQVSSAAAAAQATATESVTVVTLTSASSTQTIAVDNGANNYLINGAASTAAATSTEEAWTAEATSTTSTWEAPSSTSSSAAAATTTASSGGSGETYTGGFATYFYQGGNAGACGTVHSDSDYVIAIDSNGWWADYATNNNSPYCGKSITLTNTNNGKSVTAVVADVCPSCVSDNSLDLSVAAFTAIASESDGSVPITWQWTN